MVVAPQPVGNGLAVAALVLGIIGVLFAPSLISYVIGLLCGVLGLVFGLLGRRNVTARGASLGGLATAGIVLGCVAIALGLHTFWEWNRIRNAIRSFGRSDVAAVDADPTANKVRVTSCYRDPATHAPAAAGTLVNTSGVKQAFRVTIGSVPSTQTTVFGTGTTGEVSPGSSASWTARDLGASFLPTSCKTVRSATGRP